MARIETIAACHPLGIILREKDMSPEEYRMLAVQVIEICRRYDVKCILHSFTDVAINLQTDSIHLPLHLLGEQSDDKKAHFKEIGASCHSVEDAVKAQEFGCTYITAGHIFETDCKMGLPGRGLEFLKKVCDAVDIPVYAIGGINAGNIGSVREKGASGVCLMSSLMVSAKVTELMKAMGNKNDI